MQVLEKIGLGDLVLSMIYLLVPFCSQGVQ